MHQIECPVCGYSQTIVVVKEGKCQRCSVDLATAIRILLQEPKFMEAVRGFVAQLQFYQVNQVHLEENENISLVQMDITKPPIIPPDIFVTHKPDPIEPDVVKHVVDPKKPGQIEPDDVVSDNFILDDWDLET